MDMDTRRAAGQGRPQWLLNRGIHRGRQGMMVRDGRHARGPAWVGGLLLVGCLVPAAARCDDVLVSATSASNEAIEDVADDDTLEFDVGMLRQRGLDPGLADYFSRGTRFAPGKQSVALVVNTQRRGNADATFDADGTLCFDAALLDVAGLKLPPASSPGGELACDDFMRAYPATAIDLDPGTRTVSLLVPGESRKEGKEGVVGYQRGGVAGLFNYSVMGTRSDGRGGASTYVAAITEAGFNAGDWIFRSRQSFTRSAQGSNWDTTQSFAQRTFAQQKMVVQLGELDMVNPVMPGMAFTGMQLLPEAALQVSDGPVITGIAQSTARVEVRQRDILLYATVVEAGQFTLSGLPPLSAFTDVVVSVVEADGSEHGFTVPAVALSGLVRPRSGYTFSAGQVRNIELAPGRQPWLASASWSGALGGWGTGSVGMMLAQDYTAVGSSAFVGWDHGTSINPYAVVSHAREAGGTAGGWQAGISVQQSLGSQLSLNAAVAAQSRDYRELIDMMSVAADGGTRAHYREQANVALGWTSKWLGAISAGYSRATVFDGQPTSRATLSWGKNYRWATVSLNAEQDLGRRDRPDDDKTTVQGDNYRVYLSVSVPMGGRRRGRVSAQHDRSGERVGVSVSDSLDNSLSYRVAVDRDSSSGRTDGSLSAAWLPRYLQMSASHSRSTTGNSSTSMLFSGGLAAHSQGLTLSPYPIQDTFGIIALHDKVAGVEVDTPYGPVWTDFRGKAVVAQLSPFVTTMVEVEPESLPRNMTLDNGMLSLEAGRGAVARFAFDTRYSRRIQLLPKRPDGTALPRGTAAFRENDDLAGVVTAGGSLFVLDAVPGETLELHLPDESVCTLSYTLDDDEDTTVTIASATVPCIPATAREVSP